MRALVPKFGRKPVVKLNYIAHLGFQSDVAGLYLTLPISKNTIHMVFFCGLGRVFWLMLASLCYLYVLRGVSAVYEYYKIKRIA